MIPYGHPSNVREVKYGKDKNPHVTFRGYPMDLVVFSNLIYPHIFLLDRKSVV